jgi:hypothetical protein
MFNFLHRHITFPLVYGDPEQFNRRKKAYFLLPLFFLLLTVASLLAEPPPALAQSLGKSLRIQRPFFIALLMASFLWNVYHTMMQKVGLLRIYSRKAGWGDSRLDKAVIFSWFLYLFLQLGALEAVRHHVGRLAVVGRVLNAVLQPVFAWFPFLAILALAGALVVTFFYLRKELANPRGFHVPKNLFLLSILMLYSVFFYDFLVGYAVLGFSHAVEYLAFVNIFSRRKFLARPESSSFLARAVRHQALSFGIFTVTLLVIYFVWRGHSRTTLEWYIVGSSFLHFLYDGWIWKVRQPEVGKPLGVVYETPSAQPA